MEQRFSSSLWTSIQCTKAYWLYNWLAWAHAKSLTRCLFNTLTCSEEAVNDHYRSSVKLVWTRSHWHQSPAGFTNSEVMLACHDPLAERGTWDNSPSLLEVRRRRTTRWCLLQVVCLHTKRLLVEHVDDYVVNRHWRKRSNTVRTPELLFSIQLRGTSRSKMADAQYGELEKLSMHTCRLRHHEEKREHFYELLWPQKQNHESICSSWSGGKQVLLCNIVSDGVKINGVIIMKKVVIFLIIILPSHYFIIFLLLIVQKLTYTVHSEPHTCNQNQLCPSSTSSEHFYSNNIMYSLTRPPWLWQGYVLLSFKLAIDGKCVYCCLSSFWQAPWMGSLGCFAPERQPLSPDESNGMCCVLKNRLRPPWAIRV